MTKNPDIITIEGEQPNAGAEDITESDPRRRSWLRRVMRRLGLVVSKLMYFFDCIFGELVSVALGLGITCLWFAASVLDMQSTDLTFLRPNIKMWFAEAFDGRDTEFGALELAWRPVTGNVVVTIEEAEIRGAEGETLEKFDLVKMTLAPNRDLFSRPRLINAEVKGGVLTYLEDAEGNVTAGLGPPDKVGSIEPVYRSGDSKQHDVGIRSLLDGFEFVQIENALICVRSEKLGLDFNADVENLRVNFSNFGDLILTASGTVEQTSGVMPFKVSSVSDTNFEAVRLRLNVEGARFDEIAPTKGRFWEFRGLAAPVNLTVDVDFDRIEGLRSASVDVDIGQGEFSFLRSDEFRNLSIESLVARASLAPGEERMDIGAFDLISDKLSFNSSGFFTELGNLNDGDPNSSPVFNLSMRDILANMTPRFAVETKVDGLEIVGQVDVDSRRLEIASGTLDVFDTLHAFDGIMTLKDDNQLKSLKLNSTMSGLLNPKRFLELWPVNAFKGARDWVEAAVLDSDMTQVDVELNFDEDFFETRALTDDRLKFRFAGKNTSVKYMQTLPPATSIVGRGEIIGNALRVFLDSGQVEAINLKGGVVEIPRLRPKNGDIIVTIDGEGALSDFMQLADYPPYEIAKRYDVDPKTLSGEGEVTIKIRRPLVPYLPADQIDYEIKGNFTGASAPFELGKYKLSDGDLSVDANKDRVIIEGPVDIGPWRADTRWFETLGPNAQPTEYSASGIVDADLLDELGLGSRTWFEGSAAVQVKAKGRGMNVEGADLNVDLTNSGLSLEGLWMKPVGDTGKLSGQLKRTGDGGFIIENGELSGAGIDIRGEMRVQSDYKLHQMDLMKMSVPSLIDGAVKIIPDRVAGVLNVELDASYLNVTPWTENLFVERKSNLDVPLTLKGSVDQLVLDENYIVTDSNLYFSHTGEVIETARLEALSDDKPLKLELSTREDMKRQLDVNVPDASKAVSAFMGLNNTKGGRLTISANLPAAGEDGAYVGTAEMRDFKVREAPAFAQLLSLASLTGLADTLSNGSMQFDKFKVPFTLLGDNIAIRDARLYGPALGMTGDGDVDLDLRVLDFDGTLVPAYTANSFLGDIPLLGDLFVQEKDGGLFALTYTVTGPFEKTKIAVNPLSALTPGFLRRIFKRNRSKIDDAMKEAIADVQPKAEKTP